jgi:hypothetical protein
LNRTSMACIFSSGKLYRSVIGSLGYPHPSTSIFISKKEYFILVIEILYSISISPAPVLSLSHTLYPLFRILFPSFPLSPQLSLIATVFSGCSYARSVAVFCVAGTLAARLQACGAHHAYATSSVPAALVLPGADSFRIIEVSQGNA